MNSEWRELLVDIDPADTCSLRWIKAKNATPALKLFAADFATSKIFGDHLEVCPQTVVHIENIIDRINSRDGKSCLYRLMLNY